MLLGSLSWGDSVYFAHWQGAEPLLDQSGEKIGGKLAYGKAHVFARGIISRITIEEPDVRIYVINELSKAGKVTEIRSGGRRLVRRACGTYVEGGAVIVKASLKEIYEVACKSGKDFHVMIMGNIAEVYTPVREINAPFTRGLMAYNDASDTTVEPEYTVENSIIEVGDHVIAKRKDDFAIPLALPAA